jgi:hypothetical protein
MPGQDGPGRRAGAGAEVQEREFGVVAERQQLGHQPAFGGPVGLLGRGLGDPVSDYLLRAPDLRVRVSVLVHAAQATE